LREFGVADLVPFPQLVVVGDQSSGKSSVLESVTSFAFPRASELCTRHATQITCRREDFESIHISIIPSQESNDHRKERLRNFVHSVNKDDLTLADVFTKANEAMGLRGVKDGSVSGSAFAEDILKSEMGSPKKKFKNVAAEFHRMLLENVLDLERMSPSQSWSGSQRQFLGQIASDFQNAARRARDEHYNGMVMFDENPNLRLVTLIVSINEEFNNVVALRGHMRNFDMPVGKEGSAKKSPNCVTSIEPDGKLTGILKELEYEFLEPLKKYLLADIERIFHQSRGAELDRRTIMLRLKCPDDSTFKELHDNFLLPKLRASYQRAMEHAQFLIEVELREQPHTLNHYFNASLQAYQTVRFQEAINISVQMNQDSSEAAGWWVPKAMLPRLTTNRFNVERVREDIHDILRGYYNIARKLFVDVVLQQVIFHLLLDARDSPSKTFC
ncbi:interferon-induced gtp-binding protein mx1, partial [Colletotrichum incanum]